MTNAKSSENRKYNAALYMRLSRDDEGAGESSSIITQRKMLRAYAMENKFIVYDEYIDDGVSGTTFERTEFKRMIRDIEEKKVNLVITKDLSRLGREYIQTGQYTEIYFPLKKVRYIAINDGYDSDSPYTDIAPFKNVINEMYARDTSKKIRSAFITHMQEGAFIGAFAPYGYKRDPLDKHHLVINDEPANIVRKIFESAAKGIPPVHISKTLNQEGIITPAMYRCSNNPALDINNYTQRKEWTSSTITKMLHNIVYLGHMAQGKTTKVSFKSDVTITNPKEDWFIIENTHEPIVSQEIYDLASRRSKLRICEKKGRFHNIFSGLVRCADCGRNMSTTISRKKDANANLVCGGYKLYGKSECSNHFIDYDTLNNIVLSILKEIVSLSDNEKNSIIRKALEKYNKSSICNKPKKEISEIKKRAKKIDAHIEKLYEDYVEGLLNADTFRKLLEKYQSESNSLNKKLFDIDQKEKSTTDDTYANLKTILEEYTNIKKLTPEILYRLIDHIEIGQGEFRKTDNQRIKKQNIKIHFRFTGKPVTKQITA